MLGPAKGLNLAQNLEENSVEKALSDAGADVAPAPAPAPQQTTPPDLPQQEPQPADPSVNQLLDQLPTMQVDEVSAVPAVFEEAEQKKTEPVTASEGPSGKIKYVERNEDSEIILELALDDRQTIIDSGIVGYLVDETVLLPLSRFTELLDFPITVDTSKGSAEGWFIKEENTFRLYSPFKSIEIAGKKIPFDQRGIAEAHLDDIYVSQDLLTSWFPIELTLNYGELRLYMKTLVDLPFQERAKRKARWEASKQAAAQPGYSFDPKELIRLPYKMLAAPSLELSHGYSHNRSATGSISSTAHSLNAEADLLGMDARYNMSYQTSTAARSEVQGVKFSMMKEDFEGTLLGPAKATRFSLGDIGTGAFPLAGQQQGRGFSFNNEPYNFIRDPDNFRIDGFGPVGWDVEIFQDMELIAFAEIGVDGRYEFATLPLGEGFNLFKIVLYGPNGEKEEKYERFYLGQNMVDEGKVIYNLAMLQSSSPLFDFGIEERTETPPTVSLIGEYGVTPYLSAMGGYYHGPISDTALDGVGVGLRTSGGRTYAQMNAFFDKSGGTSSSVLITGNLTDTISTNLTHRMDIGYPDDYYSTIRDTRLQVSKLFDFENEILPDIGITLGAGKEEEDTGRKKNSYEMRVSTNFLGLNLSNEMERSVFSDMSPDTNEGRLSGRFRSPFGTLRGELAYSFNDPYELRTGTLSLQTDLTDVFSMTNGVDYSFGTDRTAAFNSALDWKLDKVRLGLRGTIDNRRNKQIGFTVGYSLAPNTQYGDYSFVSRATDVNSGRLMLRPYVDENANGKFDEGEPLVAGLSFRNLLRGSLSTPSKDGIDILPGISPSIANRIGVDEKSIADIYLTPAKKEIVVLGKRGVSGPVDFAFSKLGSISGTIVGMDENGEEIPLDAIHMILLDAEGKEAADTYSEFDGYFSFDAIPVGRYEMFFPASATLQQYYSGSGEGPTFTLDFDNPEQSDLKLRIDKDQIILENDSGEIPAAEPMPQKESGLFDKLKSMSLKLE